MRENLSGNRPATPGNALGFAGMKLLGDDPPSSKATLGSTVASTLVIDMYTNMFEHWGDPTPTQAAQLASHMPDYVGHLANAKRHVATWVGSGDGPGLRDRIVQTLTTVHALAVQFVEGTAESMKADVAVIQKEGPASPAGQAALKDIRDAMKEVIDAARDLRTTAEALTEGTADFASSVKLDVDALSRDYERLQELTKDLHGKLEESAATQEEIASLQAHYAGMVVGAVLSAAATVTSFASACLTMLAPGGQVIAAGLFVVSGVCASATGAFATDAANTCASINEKEERLVTLNEEISEEQAAIFAASGLTTHFGGFRNRVDDLKLALDSLVRDMDKIPRDLEAIQDEAERVRAGSAPLELATSLANLKRDFEDLRDDSDRVLELLAVARTEEPEVDQRSSNDFQEAAA